MNGSELGHAMACLDMPVWYSQVSTLAERRYSKRYKVTPHINLRYYGRHVARQTRRHMLNKNFDSERGSKNRESDGRSWIEPLWALIFSLTLIALFPVSLEAQGTSAMAPAGIPASVYGGGVQAPLQFAGESQPANEVTLSMGAAAFYDGNVLSTSSSRAGDEAVSLNSHLGITRRSEHLAASFDYTPFFLVYRQFDQYDRLNHSGDVNVSGRLTSRTILGLHDTISYENGMYPTLTGQQILSGLASPAGLNQMVIPYTTRTLANVAGLDLTFEKSRRTSLTLSGNYSQRKFGQQTAGQPLYDNIGLGGSLTYQYSVTEHTSIGILLGHQDTTFQGGQVFGNRLRTQTESTFISLGSRLSPTVSVIVFGGPQYIRTIGQVAPGAVLSGHFQGSGGGEYYQRSSKDSFRFDGPEVHLRRRGAVRIRDIHQCNFGPPPAVGWTLGGRLERQRRSIGRFALSVRQWEDGDHYGRSQSQSPLNARLLVSHCL